MKKKKSMSSDPMERAERELASFKFKDLQIAVVSRGMDFEEVLKSGHPKLASWFMKHYERSQSPNLVNEFDLFIEGKLIERGHKKGDAMLSPSLRFGYTKGIETLTEVKVIPSENKPTPVIIPKEEKPKREKDEETGIMKGTKKALTYELTRQGLSPDKIILAVTAKFPDAKDKSIKIWIKRAQNEQND